jgi:hypothetical protein
MTRAAFCRKSPRVPSACWRGSWALGTSDRGGQDKARKVRVVGRLEVGSNFNHAPNIAGHRAHFAMFDNVLSLLDFQHPIGSR